MNDILLVFSEEFLALLFGLIVFNKLSIGYKIIVFQVALAFVVDIICFFIRKRHTNNTSIYNIYLIADCGLLLLAGKYFNSYKYTKFIGSAFFVFLLTWCYSILTNGIYSFAVDAYIIESLLLVVLFLFILYSAIIKSKKSISRIPLFWICMGIVLFYACNIPFFSTYAYLLKHLSPTRLDILQLGLKILNTIRYLFFAIGFFLFLLLVNFNKETDVTR